MNFLNWYAGLAPKSNGLYRKRPNSRFLNISDSLPKDFLHVDYDVISLPGGREDVFSALLTNDRTYLVVVLFIGGNIYKRWNGPTAMSSREIHLRIVAGEEGGGIFVFVALGRVSSGGLALVTLGRIGADESDLRAR